jgi:hypothetical protein
MLNIWRKSTEAITELAVYLKIKLVERLQCSYFGIAVGGYVVPENKGTPKLLQFFVTKPKAKQAKKAQPIASIDKDIAA